MVTEETLTPSDHLFELETPKTNRKIEISMPDLEFSNDIVEIFFLSFCGRRGVIFVTKSKLEITWVS